MSCAVVYRKFPRLSVNGHTRMRPRKRLNRRGRRVYGETTPWVLEASSAPGAKQRASSCVLRLGGSSRLFSAGCRTSALAYPALKNTCQSAAPRGEFSYHVFWHRFFSHLFARTLMAVSRCGWAVRSCAIGQSVAAARAQRRSVRTRGVAAWSHILCCRGNPLARGPTRFSLEVATGPAPPSAKPR
jgi:hypothetical protein